MLEYYTRPTATYPDFGSLKIEDFERAGIRVVERHYGRRDLIFSPDDPDDRLYFLVGGTVRLYKIYGNYREATIALLKDRGVFGRIDLEEGQGQDTFAEPVTDVRLFAVRKSGLIAAIQRRPELAIGLFSAFSERLEQSDEVIESLLDREVSVRLARLLLTLADRFGEPDGSGMVLDVRLTHQDLANMVASSREAVSKAMGCFQREGLVQSSRWRISVSRRLEELLV